MLVCHDNNPQRVYRRQSKKTKIPVLPVRYRNERITIDWVNTFFTSLGKVLAEIENRLSGNNQVLLYALGDVTLSDSPASDSFDLVACY